jgi:hypothetical protein
MLFHRQGLFTYSHKACMFWRLQGAAALRQRRPLELPAGNEGGSGRESAAVLAPKPLPREAGRAEAALVARRTCTSSKILRMIFCSVREEAGGRQGYGESGPLPPYNPPAGHRGGLSNCLLGMKGGVGERAQLCWRQSRCRARQGGRRRRWSHDGPALPLRCCA